MEVRQEGSTEADGKSGKKKGGVIRQVMTSGDTLILWFPSAVGELVKSALGERPETGAEGGERSGNRKWDEASAAVPNTC